MVDVPRWDYTKETYGHYVHKYKKELGIDKNTPLWGTNSASEQAAKMQGMDPKRLNDLNYLKEFSIKHKKAAIVNPNTTGTHTASLPKTSVSDDNTFVAGKITPANPNIFDPPVSTKTTNNAESLLSGNDKNVKVVVEGDSLTNGYFNPLKKLLGKNVETVNLAHDGDSLGKQIKSELSSVLNQYDPNKQNVVVLTAGTNDIHNGAKGDKVYNDLLNTAKILKEKGFKVVVGTSIKLNGSGKNEEEPKKLAERKKYNDLIRSTSSAPWDKVVDLGSLKEFDDRPESNVTGNRAIYDSGQVHLTGKGYQSMANAIYQTL